MIEYILATAVRLAIAGNNAAHDAVLKDKVLRKPAGLTRRRMRILKRPQEGIGREGIERLFRRIGATVPALAVDFGQAADDAKLHLGKKPFKGDLIRIASCLERSLGAPDRP